MSAGCVALLVLAWAAVAAFFWALVRVGSRGDR